MADHDVGSTIVVDGDGRLAGIVTDRDITRRLDGGAAVSTIMSNDTAPKCDDVTEWDYGAFEGRRTAEIRLEVPGWSLWREGVPGGETAAEVRARANRAIDRVRHAAQTDSSSPTGTSCTCWLGLGPNEGRLLALDPANISVLGWEREQRVLRRWNEVVDR